MRRNSYSEHGFCSSQAISRDVLIVQETRALILNRNARSGAARVVARAGNGAVTDAQTQRVFNAEF
jgi:hypothetical protein